MPIYVYRCESCGAIEEHLQRFSDPPMESCETCKGHLTKQISAAAFHLKGGGWYKDGYASAKPAAESSSSGAESKGAESKGGESKSAESKSGDKGKSDASSKPTESKPKKTTGSDTKAA